MPRVTLGSKSLKLPHRWHIHARVVSCLAPFQANSFRGPPKGRQPFAAEQGQRRGSVATKKCAHALKKAVVIALIRENVSTPICRAHMPHDVQQYLLFSYFPGTVPLSHALLALHLN